LLQGIPISTQDSVRSLLPFGFTELEAEAYVFLLRESPATGYRVAQAIGKPVANTYKAVESLHKKGAILVDSGANRLCRAVPAEELLARLERGFQKNRRQAAKTLARLRGAQDDERIYQLQSREQVFERCHQMLERAQQMLAADVFPDPLDEIKANLESTATRGVKVAIRAYQPAIVAGAEVFVDPAGASTLKRWPGQWLNLVVDGQEFLLAFLNSDGKHVHQAVWSSSVYLSWVYYSAVFAELSLGALRQCLQQGATTAEMRRTLEQHRRLFNLELPGYRTLLERFAKTGQAVTNV
jgi:sugar-specific transcriptional regulator TrmB